MTAGQPFVFPGQEGDMEMMQRYYKKLEAEKAAENARKKREESLAASTQSKPSGSGVAGPGQEGEAGTPAGTGLTADDYAAGAEEQNIYGLEDGEPWVLRSLPAEYDIPYGATNPYANKGSTATGKYTGEKSALDLYQAEYQKRILDNDPTFRDWLSRRSLIVFGKDLYDENGQFNTLEGEAAWTQFGVWTAANPDIQESMTPEKYADSLYNTYGGDAAYDRLMEEKAKANEEKSPIIKKTTVSSMTMNKQAAEAAVDDLARGLLGRMASDSELAKYRKQINAFLKSNPNIRTEVQDSTDPNDIKVTSSEKAGATPTDAANVLEMKMRRGSEGMAFNVGQMFEEAMRGL